jgi:hypothetical protein
VTCSVTGNIFTSTGIMLYFEIQRGKRKTRKWSDQYRELGAMALCSIRATTKMANCGQKSDEHRRNLILADSWFSSIKSVESIHESGHEWIGDVKTSHSLFPKPVLEDKLKPDGMNLTLEAMASKGVKLIAVRYKYNSSKVLCFVATKIQVQQLLVIPTEHAFWLTMTI